jgi:hypothetical protein
MYGQPALNSSNNNALYNLLSSLPPNTQQQPLQPSLSAPYSTTASTQQGIAPSPASADDEAKRKFKAHASSIVVARLNKHFQSGEIPRVRRHALHFP